MSDDTLLRDIDSINPVMPYLRQERIPHIWCPSCGIGTTVNCFTRALTESGMNLDEIAIVSGIGCTGRVAGYLNLDSFHTTHGRAIPFATGLKLANPKLKVVVYSGDGDLTAIGGNHLVHAARRNMDLMVICVNNFTYGMTGGQVAPTTPLGAKQTTMPFGNYEAPFSLPFLGRCLWRNLCRALDGVSRAPTGQGDVGGTEKARLRIHRGALALPDAVSAPQQARRRRGRVEVLQGEQRGQEWRRHQRGGADLQWPHRRRQVRGPRTPHLAGRHERTLRQGSGIRVHALRRSRWLAQHENEIRVGGLGGQGIILCGSIIGKAAAIYSGRHAALIQAFGPEARGSACSAQVIVADEAIGYPYVRHPDILVLLSQDAFVQFAPQLKPDGLVLYENELVQVGRQAARDGARARHPGHPLRRGAGPAPGAQHRHDRVFCRGDESPIHRCGGKGGG